MTRKPIFSTDEDAPEKLSARIEKLERDQVFMRKANGLVRKQDVPGLVAMGMAEHTAQKLLLPDFAGRKGFPDYLLSNNNANIRRLKLRLSDLTRAEKEAA